MAQHRVPAAAPGADMPHEGLARAALGLSLASTGTLATLFALTGGHAAAGNQLAAATIVANPRAATPTVPASAASAPVATSTAATTPAVAVATPAIVDGAVFHNKWG